MLYLIGLGLNNEKDITINGLEVVRRAERVYLEAYTAILMVPKDKLVCVPPADSTPLTETDTCENRKLSTVGR